MLGRLFKPKNPLRQTYTSPGRYVAASGYDLLQAHANLVTAIRALVGVPPTHWDGLYSPMLERFAALVQFLPASEAHHHAGPGGLLRHGLEVAHEALRLRRSALLPQGAAAEEVARVQDLQTFACASGALLHDIGKPAVDQHVQLFDTMGKCAGTWSPLSGPMPQGTHYEVTFNRGRSYRRHERIAPLLAHFIVPTEGLRWLASETALLDAWLAAIQGDMDEAGPLGVIIGKADGLSVARNVSGGIDIQMPTARAKPLADRLAAGLRHLLTSEALPLNRPGAAAFISDDTLWLVSKRALDALREHLIQEGQPGIPSRNDRLMDELQQQGVIVAYGDRAVWNCQIQIGDWTQQLSCLRMEASRIWPDADQRPTPLAGTVSPIEGEGEQPESPVKISPTNSTPDEDSAAQASALPPTFPQSLTAAPSIASDVLPMPFDIDDGLGEVTPVITNQEQGIQEIEQVGPLSANGVGTDTDARSCEWTTMTRPTRPRDTQVMATAAEPASEAAADLGERFVEWLRQNIIERRVEINTPRARLHVLQEGLALVSPGIFRDFDPAKWSQVQKRFQKLKRHRKTPDDMNIWTCRVAKDRKQSLIKVFLIEDPMAALSLTELPPPNEAITLLEDGTNEEATP